MEGFVIDDLQLERVVRQVVDALPNNAETELRVIAQKFYMTPLEVQKLYGLNEGTLRNLRNQGRGPAYYQEDKNGRVKYDHKSIQDYLAKTKKVTADAN